MTHHHHAWLANWNALQVSVLRSGGGSAAQCSVCTNGQIFLASLWIENVTTNFRGKQQHLVLFALDFFSIKELFIHTVIVSAYCMDESVRNASV